MCIALVDGEPALLAEAFSAPGHFANERLLSSVDVGVLFQVLF